MNKIIYIGWTPFNSSVTNHVIVLKHNYLNIPFICKVGFVSHQHDYDITSPFRSDIIDPFGGLLERVNICRGHFRNTGLIIKMSLKGSIRGSQDHKQGDTTCRPKKQTNKHRNKIRGKKGGSSKAGSVSVLMNLCRKSSSENKDKSSLIYINYISSVCKMENECIFFFINKIFFRWTKLGKQHLTKHFKQI